ncbi:peptidylprolyl isomerase [Hirschia baltica]|uniref:Parvulin-like PPIase n=1 Tax=Hirschia baltica (strain ATCC 49814 / DSM 5838 / IFAM 1418) TaxID=582402 RepID=C6XKP8_HIRBI|nr:SurA N-terminal domain-containing protein [Hirschia baltica]ACT59615.1 SurA domain protein [Hirschia baltica ATCC 49814]
MRLTKSKLKYIAPVIASFLAYAPIPVHAQSADASNVPQIEAVEGTVAIVNDQPISYSDVRQRAQFILVSLGVQPNAETIRQAQTRAIEGLIDEKLQLQEAETYELVVEEAEIDDSIANIAARSNATPEDFLQGLAQVGLSPRTLRDQIRADIAWRRLVGGRFGSRVRISSLQIDDNLERLNKSMEEPQYRIAEIFLPGITQEEISVVYQGAEELKRQIENQAAPFEAVARQFSAAPTASAGGEIGWLGESQLKKEYADQVRALSKPGLTDPIVTDNGVYLVSLMNKQAPVEEALVGFKLKQIYATGADAVSKVDNAAAQIENCAALDNESASQEGVAFVDFGVTQLTELSQQYQDLFNAQSDNSHSAPIMVADNKAAIVYVCSHEMSRGNMPTRADIEDKLHGEMVDMMASRYLRDLRRDATIIRR